MYPNIIRIGNMEKFTKKYNYVTFMYGLLAQLDRVPGFDPGG